MNSDLIRKITKQTIGNYISFGISVLITLYYAISALSLTDGNSYHMIIATQVATVPLILMLVCAIINTCYYSQLSIGKDKSIKENTEKLISIHKITFIVCLVQALLMSVIAIALITGILFDIS